MIRDAQKNVRLRHARRKTFNKSALSKVIEGDATSAIDAIRSGFSVMVFLELATYLNLSMDQLCQAVRFRSASIQSRVEKKGTLTHFESDTLYRVGKLIKQAQDVFENETSASNWIVRKNSALGGVSPLSVLDSTAGYSVTMQVLGRIEQGVPV